MNITQLKEVLETAILHKDQFLLAGPPGIGKTDIVKQVCETTKTNLIISHPAIAEPTDFKGFPFVIKHQASNQTEAKFIPFSELKELIDAKEPTMFFLDDLGQASVTVQKAVMQLIYGRRINDYRISDHVVFMGATNRREDNAGVTNILNTIKSRFTSIIDVEVDLQSWIDWAYNNNMPYELIAFIKYRPGLLLETNQRASIDLRNTPCPRTVAAVGDILNHGYPEDLLHILISGAVGEGFATEFMSFRKLYRNLSTPGEALQNPDTFQVPTDISELYALCVGIISIAKYDKIEQIITVSKRLPEEFSMMLMKDLINKHPDFAETPEYIRWVTEGNLL